MRQASQVEEESYPPHGPVMATASQSHLGLPTSAWQGSSGNYLSASHIPWLENYVRIKGSGWVGLVV